MMLLKATTKKRDKGIIVAENEKSKEEGEVINVPLKSVGRRFMAGIQRYMNTLLLLSLATYR